jgi:hypothetical protein
MAQSIILHNRINVDDARTTPATWIIPVAQWTAGAVQIVAGHNVTGTPTIKVQQSLDGITAADFASALSTSSLPYMTAKIDLWGTAYVHVTVTTDGTAGFIDCYFVGKTD